MQIFLPKFGTIGAPGLHGRVRTTVGSQMHQTPETNKRVGGLLQQQYVDTLVAQKLLT